MNQEELDDDCRLPSPDEVMEAMSELLEAEPSTERDNELICGCALLAEAYEKKNEYETIKEAAELALRVIDEGTPSQDIIIEVLERLASAVEGTHYNHMLRELLANLITAAYKADPEAMDNYSHEAKKLVALDILLEKCPFDRPDKELTAILAGMFTSRELLDIIERPAVGFLMVDPVEYTWKFEEIAPEVEAKINEILAGQRRGMGFCFHYWSVKADVLKQYGIDWKSPHTMNPGVMFD